MGRQVKSLEEVRIDLHNQILELRSIEGFINRQAFEQVWNESTDESKEAALLYIGVCDKGSLQDWVKKHPSKDIGELPVSRLKQIAAKMRIVGYSRMSKRDLVSTITKGAKK